MIILQCCTSFCLSGVSRILHVRFFQLKRTFAVLCFSGSDDFPRWCRHSRCKLLVIVCSLHMLNTNATSSVIHETLAILRCFVMFSFVPSTSMSSVLCYVCNMYVTTACIHTHTSIINSRPIHGRMCWLLAQIQFRVQASLCIFLTR